MITTKHQLNFYISADRIMKGLAAKRSFKDVMLTLIGFRHYVSGGLIMEYQRHMRFVDYYQNKTHRGMLDHLLRMVHKFHFDRLGLKLGFSLNPDSFGYGLVIPHYGTIVINGDCKFGNYCVLHTSTCIAGGGKSFGNGFYLSSGAKVTGIGTYGDAVSIAANSVANRPAVDHCLLAGMPAEVKKTHYPYWYERDGERFWNRVARIEDLKNCN